MITNEQIRDLRRLFARHTIGGKPLSDAEIRGALGEGKSIESALLAVLNKGRTMDLPPDESDHDSDPIERSLRRKLGIEDR